MVPDNSTGIPRVPAYSGGAPYLSYSGYGNLTLCVPAFQPVPLVFLTPLEHSFYPGTCLNTAGLGSSPFARRYLGNRCYFLFLQVLRCFSSLRSPPLSADVGIAPHGLPHSDICGSMRICRSPQLFAACHVLHRLREPRHPPCALRIPLYPSVAYTATYLSPLTRSCETLLFLLCVFSLFTDLCQL